MTAPLPPDPADVTDGDRAKATEVLFRSGADNYAVAIDYIAAALAAERAAVARPVLALAEELDDELAATGVLLDRAIRPGDRLRAAVAASLGETGGGQ